MNTDKLMAAGTATATAAALFPLIEGTNIMSDPQALVLAACLGMAWGATFAALFKQAPKDPAPVEIVPARQALPTRAPQQPPAQVSVPANARQLFEQTITNAIRTAWSQSTYKAEKQQPGHFSIDIGSPTYYSSTVVFRLTLTNLLPSPQVEAVIDSAFIMALRAELSKISSKASMVDRVTARLRYRVVEVSIPNPSQNVDMHVSKFLSYAKAGVPLDYHDRQDKDIWGIVGVDAKDRIVYLDFPWNTVSLYVGGQRSGKTAALMGMLLSVLAKNGPDRIELYIAAARPKQWEPFSHLPHCKALVFDGASIEAMLAKLWKETAKGVGIDSNGTHKSRILVVDDLSTIAKFYEWRQIASHLIQLVTAGGGGQTYTIITTHRTRQSGGVGDAGTAIVANAGYRVVTYTSDNIGSFADALNVPSTVAQRMPMPLVRKEALVTENGGDPKLIRTIYAKPEDANSPSVASPTHPATKTDNGNPGRDTRGWGSLPPMYKEGEDTERAMRSGREHSAPDPDTQPHTDIDATQNPTQVGHVSAHGQNGAADTNGAINPDSYISAASRREVKERDGNRCTYCQGEGTETVGPDQMAWHYDHMKPKALGGSGHPDNVCLSCRTCNQKKGAMNSHEFIEMQMRQMDGRIPKLTLYDDGYRPSPWQKMQMWFAYTYCKKSLRSIMTDAGLGTGGAQSEKVKGWIAEGSDYFERIRTANQDQDRHPTGVDLSAFVDEIERRESECRPAGSDGDD